MFVSLPLARFSGEIPSRFCDFSRRYGQENFRPAFWRRGRRSVRLRGTGADFSFASSDFKALGAFFCNFPNWKFVPKPFARIYLISIGYTESKPKSFLVIFSQLVSRSRARSAARPCTTSCGFARFRGHTISGRGFNLFKPLRRHFRANSVSLSHRDPGDRNASAQKIDDRLDGLLRAAAQERLGSHPQIASFQTVVLHAGLETPRPPGEDRGRPKTTKNTIACVMVFQKEKSTQKNRLRPLQGK